MSTIRLVTGDLGPANIPLYITNTVTGLAVDLTTMVSARLLFRPLNGAPGSLITTVVCTVQGAATLGILQFTPNAAMTTTAGNFEAEVELTMPAGVIVTGYDFVLFQIRAQIT